MSIVGSCEARNWKSLDAARECTERSTVATESRMSMLDGRKRSVEDVDCADGEVSLFKKAVCKTASPQESCVSKGTNSNCAIVNINATTVTGVAGLLKAAGVDVEDKVA